MARTMKTSDDASAGGGNFLDLPGTYHFMVTASEETATDKDSKPLDAFSITGTVLDGTTRDAKGKCVEIGKFHKFRFYDPKPSDKNEGAFARKKQTRALIAIGIMHPSEVGKDVTVDLSEENTQGRQFVASVSKEKGSDGKEYLGLAFADVFHVDDPDAAAFPKCAESLKMLPAEWRLPVEAFAGISKSSTAAPSNQGGANGHKPSTNGNGSTAASKPKVDVDDII